MNTHSRPLVRAPRNVFCLWGIGKQRSFATRVTRDAPYFTCFAHAYISVTVWGISCMSKLRLPSATKNPDRTRSLNPPILTRFIIISGNNVRRLKGQSDDSNTRTCFSRFSNDCSVVDVTRGIRIVGGTGGYLVAGTFNVKNHALPVWNHGGRPKEEYIYPQTGTGLRLWA